MVRVGDVDVSEYRAAGVPVFRAFGDGDDHLRLGVMIAHAFGALDREASACCLDPHTPWRDRALAIEDLLAAANRASSTPVYAVLVDPDSLAAGPGDPWDDAEFWQERRWLFDAILRTARRGGWVFIRQWPRADLTWKFDDLEVDVEPRSRRDPLFESLVPAARPLARWLHQRGTLSTRRLLRCVGREAEVSELVLDEACDALPPATLRVALRLALVRRSLRLVRAASPEAVVGPGGVEAICALGPFRVVRADDATGDPRGELPAAEVEWLRVAGFLQAVGRDAVIIPAPIRKALLARGRALRSDVEVAADHAWLSQAYAGSAEPITLDAFADQLEAHHHAVEAGDLDRALATARYYGVDLRALAFRLGRAAAMTSDRALFRRASEVYRLIWSQFDAYDAYSWEYYALNLARSYAHPIPEDVALEVTEAYARAHMLAPANPLFHGRLVGFRAEHGHYDRREVELALARYRATSMARDCGSFGQAVIDGLRRAGHAEEASDLAHYWYIVPPDRTRSADRPRSPRRLGTASGVISLPDPLDPGDDGDGTT
jgi:hypothetical protein